jgi:hypothetical protein
MRSAVWSLSLREWQCEECEEAFWANVMEASAERGRRRATIAALAEPPGPELAEPTRPLPHAVQSALRLR